jgi:hypothetical protein
VSTQKKQKNFTNSVNREVINLNFDRDIPMQSGRHNGAFSFDDEIADRVCS